MSDDSCVAKLVEETSDVSWVAQPIKFRNTVLDDVYRDLMVDSVLVIYSITIQKSNQERAGKTCEIYGKITVVNKCSDDVSFDIFDRTKDEPESVDVGGTLSLLSPPFNSNVGVHAIIPSSDWVGMNFLLYDKADSDMVIARGSITLATYLNEEQFDGECGSARVHYAVSSLAVVANVDVLIMSKNHECHIDGDCNAGLREETFGKVATSDDNQEFGSADLGVFGTITARNVGCSDQKDFINSIVLFSKSSEQSVNLRSRDFIQLAKSITAIPVLSTLQIEVDLCDHETELAVCKSTLEFSPEDGMTVEKDIVKNNQLIRVVVRWVQKEKAPRQFRHRNVTPLAEMFSVSICNPTLTDGRKCEIYGHIRVVDSIVGDTFDLFTRGSDDPECIDLNGTLLLSSPSLKSDGSVRAILPLNSMKVDVCLLDKAHEDLPIALGEFPLNENPIEWKEKQICKKVSGTIGFAEMHYGILPYAIVANVDVLYFTKDDNFGIKSRNDRWPFPSYIEEDGSVPETFNKQDTTIYDELKLGSSVADIFGTVTACNDMVFNGSSGRKDCFNSSVLFRKSCEQSVKVRSGEFIQLSRSVVAVSAYSTLKIKVDLSDANTQLPIGKSTLEFIPRHYGTCKEDIVGDSGRIRVRVKWGEGCDQLDRARALMRTMSPVKPVGVPHVTLNVHGQPLVEVFSIVVCGFGFEPLNLYGTIDVISSRSCIFYVSSECPQKYASGTHVPLDCHRSFTTWDDFGLWANINKDDVDKSSISRGLIVWRSGSYVHAKCFNRRLCSIIRGEVGFAAVHYSIISDAISAKVDVKLYVYSHPSEVYGKIVASYDTNDYQSTYEKECYSSILFQRDAKEGLAVGMECGSVPLLKSVVSFPMNFPLKFDVDLSVCGVKSGGYLLPPKPLKGERELNALALLMEKGECSWEIKGYDRAYVVVSCKLGVFN